MSTLIWRFNSSCCFNLFFARLFYQSKDLCKILPCQFDHEPLGFNWAFLTNSLSNKTKLKKLDLDKSLLLTYMCKYYKIIRKKVYWSHIDFEVSNRSVQIYIWILFTKAFVCRSVTWWCFSLTDRNAECEQVAKLINHQSRPQCLRFSEELWGRDWINHEL